MELTGWPCIVELPVWGVRGRLWGTKWPCSEVAVGRSLVGTGERGFGCCLGCNPGAGAASFARNPLLSKALIPHPRRGARRSRAARQLLCRQPRQRRRLRQQRRRLRWLRRRRRPLGLGGGARGAGRALTDWGEQRRLRRQPRAQRQERARPQWSARKGGERQRRQPGWRRRRLGWPRWSIVRAAAAVGVLRALALGAARAARGLYPPGAAAGLGRLCPHGHVIAAAGLPARAPPGFLMCPCRPAAVFVPTCAFLCSFSFVLCLH